MPRITLQKARTAKAALLKEYRRLPNLSGIGITKVAGGGYGVKINLSEPMPEGVQLPAEVAGVPVSFDVTGTIRKRQ